MAFFSALGKTIEESGDPHILDKSIQLIRFWKGKAVNDVKGSMSFEILHFELYLATRNWEEVLGIILQKIKYLDCVKYQYLHISIKNLMSLPKTTFCMPL